MGVDAVGVSDAELRALIERLAAGGAQRNDSARIDRIRLLEQLEAAVGAARAVETAAFVSSQRASWTRTATWPAPVAPKPTGTSASGPPQT